MSSGELALALVSSSQSARTSMDAEGADFGGDVAQPVRTADSRSETIHLIGWGLAERRGSIVCSLRLCVAMPELGTLGPARLCPLPRRSKPVDGSGAFQILTGRWSAHFDDARGAFG
jgi:hypothetical protein